jgi:hypothetical protein
MTPYRTPGGPREEARPAPSGEDEPFLWWLAIVLGGIRVAIAIATGEDWGGEASIAGLFLGAGLVGLLRLP